MQTRKGDVFVNKALADSLPGSAYKVYSHIKSQAPTWHFYLDVMARTIGLHRKTIQKWVRYLIGLGLVTRERVRLSKGLLGGYIYKVYSIDGAKAAKREAKRLIMVRLKKAKAVAKQKVEELLRYAQRNPYISKDFTTGTFFAPSKTKEELSFNNSKTHAMNRPSSTPKNGWGFSQAEIEAQKQYILANL